MEGSTKESGLITTWKAWEYISGQMEGNTKVSIKMIKSMALASTLGLIIEDTKECGLKASSMGLVSTQFLNQRRRMVYGKMVNA